jgi:hypothetical protein
MMVLLMDLNQVGGCVEVENFSCGGAPVPHWGASAGATQNSGTAKTRTSAANDLPITPTLLPIGPGRAEHFSLQANRYCR